MGLIRVPITLGGKKRSLKVMALVDTGASLTVIPRQVASDLRLDTFKTLNVQIADGGTRRMPVATAMISLEGRSVPSTVLVAPAGEVLLGAETLELLDVSIDPKKRRLKMGTHFALKAA